jgi:hypothetical protein
MNKYVNDQVAVSFFTEASRDFGPGAALGRPVAAAEAQHGAVHSMEGARCSLTVQREERRRQRRGVAWPA